MLSEDTIGRLVNWKFTQAKAAVERQQEPDLPTEDEVELIESLDMIFGNVGWFDGCMAYIVRAAVSTLVGDEE